MDPEEEKTTEQEVSPPPAATVSFDDLVADANPYGAEAGLEAPAPEEESSASIGSQILDMALAPMLPGGRRIAPEKSGYFEESFPMASSALGEAAQHPLETAGALGANILAPEVGVLSSGAKIPGVQAAMKRTLVPAVADALGAFGGRAAEHATGIDDSEYNLTKELARAGFDTAFGAGIGGATELVPLGARMKREAAAAPDAAGNRVNLPDSIAGYKQVLKDRFSKVWADVRDSGILEGGKHFNEATGRFEGPKNAKRDFLSISENIKEILEGNPGKGIPGLKQRQVQVLNGAEAAADRYRVASGNKNFGTVGEADVARHMGKTFDKIGKLSESPFMDEELRYYVEGLNEFSSTFNIKSPILGPGGQQIVTPRRFNLPDIQTQLENVYEKLRGLGEYDARVRAAGAADKSYLKSIEQITSVYSDAANALREARDGLLGGMFSVPSVAKDLRNQKITPRIAQMYADNMHSLLTFRDVMSNLEGASSRMGARAVNATQMDPTAISGFNRPGGGIMGGVSAVANALKSPFGYGADTAAMRGRNAAMQGLRDVGGWQTGGNQNALSRGLEALGPNRAIMAERASHAVRNLAGDAEAQEIHAHFSEQGWEPVKQGPSKFPRDIRAIVQNGPQLVQGVMQVAGPEAGGMVQQILSSNLPPSEKSRSLGMLLSHIPEVADLFESPKSGAPSEMGGQIHSEEDLANIGQQIDDSPKMSLREKAVAWRSLWKDRKYSGKALYGQ